MEKLFAIVSLGQNIYGRWLFRRLLYGAIVGVSLAIVTSALTGAMLIGSFYVAYLTLLHSGIESQKAMIIIGGVGLLTTLLFVLATFRYLCRLREMPGQLLRGKASQISQASDMLDAFLDGFMGRQTK